MANRATVSEVRAWAKQQGFEIADRGRLPAEVWTAWQTAQKPAQKPAQRLPTQRPTAEAQPAAASAADLRATDDRLAALEQQVKDLAARVLDLEQRSSQPRRRFTRSR